MTVMKMEMVRLYDTTKGVIPTDEQNRILSRPGHILIVWTERDDTYRGGYTKNPIPVDNMVEEIPEGSKIEYNLNRIYDKCPMLKRMTTITKHEYVKLIVNYEHPGCLGQIAQALRIRKSFDDLLREHFDNDKPV